MTGILRPVIRTHLDAPNLMNTTDRANRTLSRRTLTAAGITTLAFSLIVSIGPALAAPGGNGNGNGNANAGTVKIHDADTSTEATGNDPYVCAFWIGFSSDSGEAGVWQVLGVPPTGDGSVAASGAYDTNGDGFEATAVLTLPNGHYRLDWTANGANAKHKTFWVACEDEGSSDEVAPSDDAAPSDASSPSEESTPSDEEADPEGGASSEDEIPSEDEAPSQDEAPSEDEAPASDSEQPSDESTPDNGADEHAGDPGASQQPEGQVKSGTSRDGESGGTGSGIPDTATAADVVNTGLSGILAAIGVLLIVVAHAGTRRERTLPTA
jgi:hypothetical protein